MCTMKIALLHLWEWFVLWAYRKSQSYFTSNGCFLLLLMLAQIKAPHTLTFEFNLSIKLRCTTSTFLPFFSLIARQSKCYLLQVQNLWMFFSPKWRTPLIRINTDGEQMMVGWFSSVATRMIEASVDGVIWVCCVLYQFDLVVQAEYVKLHDD